MVYVLGFMFLLVKKNFVRLTVTPLQCKQSLKLIIFHCYWKSVNTGKVGPKWVRAELWFSLVVVVSEADSARLKRAAFENILCKGT